MKEPENDRIDPSEFNLGQFQTADKKTVARLCVNVCARATTLYRTSSLPQATVDHSFLPRLRWGALLTVSFFHLWSVCQHLFAVPYRIQMCVCVWVWMCAWTTGQYTRCINVRHWRTEIIIWIMLLKNSLVHEEICLDSKVLFMHTDADGAFCLTLRSFCPYFCTFSESWRIRTNRAAPRGVTGWQCGQQRKTFYRWLNSVRSFKMLHCPSTETNSYEEKWKEMDVPLQIHANVKDAGKEEGGDVSSSLKRMYGA